MNQRVAVVTGGIGGLGTAIVHALAESGRQVVAADLDQDSQRVREFRTAHAGFGDRVGYAVVDVTDFASCAALIQQVEASRGPVAILVNAAGITRDVTLRKMDPAQWQAVLRVNLEGAFNMCRQVVESMSEHGFGRIINISSVNGQTGQFGQTNYAASKAGLHGLSMALARELAKKGVTVNSISPGYCRTPMVEAIPAPLREQIISQIPVGRIGEPEDIARAVRFLSEDAAGYITGINLPVNGGAFISF